MTSQLRLSAYAALATLLAALCLGGVFINGTWFGPVLLTVLAVSGSCAAARAAKFPAVVVPLLGLLALLLMLVAIYARSKAFLGFIPDADAVAHLRQLVESGRRDINRFAAPVSDVDGIMLITAAGVGFVALVVDTLAVTLHRAALAGLPLLGLYAVPAAIVPGGVSWLAFALGSAGYLALLVAEARDRVGRWGKSLGGNKGPVPESNPLGAIGRRVGAATVTLALVLPIIVPTLDGQVFGNGSVGFGTGSGTNRVRVGNPILDLKDDLRRPAAVPVLNYTTTAEQPDYLRMTTLDQFTGRVWQPSPLTVRGNRVRDGMSSPTGLSDDVARTANRTTIKITNLDGRWLPVPYPATEIDIDDSWRYDSATYNVFSTRESTKDKSYTVQSLAIVPTPEQLSSADPTVPAPLVRYLELPENLPPIIAQTTAQITKGAATPYEKALAIQKFFRDPANNFQYTTSAPDETSAGAVADFLRQRAGFCVQFASTMAVLARQAGIPARVDVGFTAGQLLNGRYVVSSDDAHAWPELFFNGLGWVRFEPTPGGAAAAPPAYTEPAPEAADPTQPGSTAAPTTEPRQLNAQQARSDALELRNQGRAPVLPTGFGATEGPPVMRWILLGVLAALLLALVPVMARTVVRRRRWRRASSPEELARAAWREMSDTATDFGRPMEEQETPRQFADRLRSESKITGAGGDALDRITTAIERAEYARTVGVLGDLRADVGIVRAELSAHASRWGRVRARLLPRSTAALVHAAAERFADALDWVDRGFASLRARLVPRRADRS